MPEQVWLCARENGEHSREWTATGTQFQIPYVFKTLFSHEPVVFADLCQTKTVSKGAIYLDKNEDLPEGEHNYILLAVLARSVPSNPDVVVLYCCASLASMMLARKLMQQLAVPRVTAGSKARWFMSFRWRRTLTVLTLTRWPMMLRTPLRNTATLSGSWQMTPVNRLGRSRTCPGMMFRTKRQEILR